MSSNLDTSISLVIETENTGDDAYGSFKWIKADVFLQGISKSIGTISGISIDRQAIPEHCFYETFDEHSATMEWIAGSLLENRYGRTTLQSLRNGGDDPEFDFFLMQQFDIDCSQPSDVAAFALRKFLQSKEIRGELQYDVWRVSSIAYALSEFPNDQSKRIEVQNEAIPFLRNGFFQDTALLQKDPDNARILVGSYSHFEGGLKSKNEVMEKAQSLFKNGIHSVPMLGRFGFVDYTEEDKENDSYWKSDELSDGLSVESSDE